MKQVKNVEEIRCYYGRDIESNWCRLGNEIGLDKTFSNVNYLSVKDDNINHVTAHLFSHPETPARPDLHIEFKEPTVCDVEAYHGYKFAELKIINCGKGDV